MSTIGVAITDILTANTALTDVVGTNIFFIKAPKGTKNPCLVYNLIDNPEDTKDGSSISHTIVQVDTYTDDGSVAAPLAQLVRDALDRVSGVFSTINIQTIIYQDSNTPPADPDSKAYRYLQNFRVRVNT